MKAAHCAYGALTIASSTSMRYPSAPKSWCSGPSSFLPFSMPVKPGPCTVVTSNAVRAFNRESQGNCSTIVGSCGFQTMKSSSVLRCLVWKPPFCNTVSAGQNMSYGWIPPDCLESCSTGNLMKDEDHMEDQSCVIKTS